ncbi:putative polyol transporter 3, partial [Mucuna pruriens]
MLYSPRIFKKAGVTNKDKFLLTTIGVGFIKVVFLTKLGEGSSCLLTMVDTFHEELLWALTHSIVTTYIFVVFFYIGLGPVTWVYSSDIFPLKLRAEEQRLRIIYEVNKSYIEYYEMSVGILIVKWFGSRTMTARFGPEENPIEESDSSDMA